MTWQLIETVPKDGTEVLLLGRAIHSGPKTGQRYVRFGYWSGFQGQFFDSNSYALGGMSWYSHWAPAPPFP